MPTCHLAASALGQVLGNKLLFLEATCFGSHFGKCSFGTSLIEDLTRGKYLSEFWVQRSLYFFDNWLVWFCYSSVILLLLSITLIVTETQSGFECTLWLGEMKCHLVVAEIPLPVTAENKDQALTHVETSRVGSLNTTIHFLLASPRDLEIPWKTYFHSSK